MRFFMTPLYSLSLQQPDAFAEYFQSPPLIIFRNGSLLVIWVVVKFTANKRNHPEFSEVLNM
jgi:hypothetical protein